MDNYLIQYRNEIKEGNIVAGQELIMQLDNLITDLENPKYIYDTTEAYKRMHFMENCIRLTKSPFYNKPMKLMLWQKAFIEAVYSFKMSDTLNDRFQKILLLIARKNTKSETCSALALTELIWGNAGSDIVCSSNDDNQASIVYDAINTMRLLIDPYEQDTKKNQRFIRCKANDSKVFKLSDRTQNKEGRNIDFAIVDEIHEMKTNVIGKSIEQSQSLKDNPKFIAITTEGFVNDGYLDEELKKCRRIIKGEDDSLMAERTLPWLYTQDSEQEVWQDEKSWQKSNPTLGIVKKWSYLKAQIDDAKTSKSDRMFVLSKDFNFKQSNAQAWLSESDYKYKAIYNIDDFKNCIALGGVDLAETTDLTSVKILLMKKDDKTKYIYQHYWIPKSKLTSSNDANTGAKYSEWVKRGLITIQEGNDNDLSSVADWFYMLYKKFGIKVLKTGYDQRFAKDFLKQMDNYGFEHEMILQNRFVMSGAMKLVEADLKDQLINYNENEIDCWCLGNTSMEIDDRGFVMPVKINGQHGKRIDGAVSLIILYEIFRRYKNEFLKYLK